MTDLYRLSACEVVTQLQAGAVSAHDALDSLEGRISAVNPTINALPTLCFERARRHADAMASGRPENRGPLFGLPVTIKDLTPVAKVRTTFGSRVYENHVPDESAQLVRRIENRGGIVYAKSNTPEFGLGGITFNEVFGITRNPRDPRFASGGSSGGAAASLAAGCAWLSHGSDMAGSLRTPAAFCGVASLRPSPGRISGNSEWMPYDVLSAEGPMARSVEDLGLFADAMFTDHPDCMLQAARSPAQPQRIAISRDLGVAAVSDQIAGVFQGFVDKLAEQNWNLVEDHPDLSGVHDCFDVLRAHSCAIALEPILAEHRALIKPEGIWNIEAGLALTPGEIREAIRTQGRIIRRASAFMEDIDLLICPATSVSAVPAELRYPGSDGEVPVPAYYRWLAIAYAVTVSALPVITVPCGLTDDGMPVGIQLIGKPGGEYDLFRHARLIEQITGWSGQPLDFAELAAPAEPADLADSADSADSVVKGV